MKTLSELIRELEDLKEKYGGNIPVVFCSFGENDNGDEFHLVHKSPAAGEFLVVRSLTSGNFEKVDGLLGIKRKVNSICIN